MQTPNGSSQSDLPIGCHGSVVRTPFGIFLPPGGKIAAFVRSTGAQANDDTFIRSSGSLVKTLAAGLTKCRSGLGDTVIVLPGHTETVSDATMLDSLVNGTNILGVGRGSAMPKFTFAAAGAQWKLDNADVMVSGLRLDLGGANNVTKAVIVTGTDNVMAGCDVIMATSSSLDAAIGIEVGTGADRFRMLNCYLRGSTDPVTDGVKIVAAVDGVEIGNCRMMFAATEVNGQVHVTAAATNLWIHHSSFANTVTNSTACIVVDDVAATGTFEYNAYSTLNNGTATAQGAIFGTGALIRSVQCFSCDEPKKSGILTPTAAT